MHQLLRGLPVGAPVQRPTCSLQRLPEIAAVSFLQAVAVPVLSHLAVPQNLAEFRHFVRGHQRDASPGQPVMAEPGLQQPLDLGLAQRITAAAGLEIHLHGEPGTPGVPQRDLRGNVITTSQQGFHPRGQLHLPLLFPAGQHVGKERTHLAFPGQRIPLGRPLPGQKTGGQELSLGHALRFPAAHAVAARIAGIRHPGIHAFVLARHPREDVALISINRLQLAADAGKQTVQFHPDFRQHCLKLELT